MWPGLTSQSIGNAVISISRRRSSTAKPIMVEDLHITNMVKNHALAKSIMDASWSAFLDILSASAGHEVIRVNPRFTSQICSQCGEIVQKSLSVRTPLCPFCSFIAGRDVNAAKNILKAGTQPSGANV